MDERFKRERMLLGDAAMEKLRESHVAVFGLGGVGSWCAEALARSGVGELTIIDCDEVSETNINRQLPALSSTVGRDKTAVTAERLADINPALKIYPVKGLYTAADRERFLADYDYIADAIDLVSCKLDLILAAREREIPVVSALGTGNKLEIESFTVCDISKTQGCPLARVMRKELRARGIEHHTVVYSPEKSLEPIESEAPPPGRRSVPASVVWAPATAGLLMCRHIVLELIK